MQGNQRILVGTEGRQEDEEALAVLCARFNPEHSLLRIAHVLAVPMTVPLDVQMPEAEEQAVRILTHARDIVSRFHIRVETALLRGRTVAESLVNEARRMGASTIVVRFRSREGPMGHVLVSPTVRALLKDAPCPVIALHLPHR